MTALEILLAIAIMIVSGFGTIILVNFKDLKIAVKEMAQSVTQLNIKLERVITDQVWHKEEIDGIRSELVTVKKEMGRARDRLHSLEGGQAQLLNWLNENKE